MSLKFWLGGATSDKSRQMMKFILEDAERNPGRQYLVVVPEQFSLSTQRELVLNSPNLGILNIDVLSFTRLAHRISDEVGSFAPDVTTLDEMGKSLIIGMLAAANRKELTVFGNDLDKLGVTDKLKSIISEFMQYGISVERAYEISDLAAADSHNLLAGKLHDVAFLYDRFKEYIKDKYTTVEDTLDAVSALVPRSDTIKNSVIVFDGFTGFTPVQNKLIGVLLEYALSVNVALLYDDCIQENSPSTSIREHELFYLSRHTMDQLGRMADERHVIIEDPYKACNSNKNNIRNSNNDIVYTDKITTPELNNIEVSLFAGSNPDEEIQMVFNRIVKLVRDMGYHYKDVAILTGDMESYRHPIEREFTKHNVPYFVDRTEPVLLNPFIEYIRSFLSIFADNYDISSVFGFLKSYLTDISDSQIDILENYCIAANIKGYKAWHQRFDVHTRTVGADELLILNDIREKLVARFDDFTGSLGAGRQINAGSIYSVRDFSTALYKMIESDEIEDKLRAGADAFLEAGNRKSATEYEKIYVQIMNVLDELCELIPDEMTDIRGFAALLNAGFDSIRIGSVPMGMDYIQIADLTRSRLGNIKALFIVGANDGVIPRAAVSSGIINESEREYLVSSIDKLTLAPTAREDIFTQRLYIYMAVNKPTQKLFVSYSRISSSGKSLLPSYIIRKLKSAFDVRIETKSGLCDNYPDDAEAFDDLTDMLYPALRGTIDVQKGARVKELLKYFIRKEEYKERLTHMIKNALLQEGGKGDSIGSALAHALYGKRIVTSITRLEAYANCAYRYFLEYGLTLREREIFSFEARDMGNIFHDSMKTYSQMMQENHRSWADISEDEINETMDKAVDAVIEKYREEKLSTSARYAYMENRIRKIMRRSASVVSKQIRKGKFTPKYFEVDFDELTDNDTLSVRLSDEDIMRLRGRIDRVDTCETDDGIYIRVIDYKSSNHEMDLAAVYEGRQLQLLVYLNAAMGMEKKSAQKTGKSPNIIPAGVFYYHMDDPIVGAREELTEDDIKTLIMKDLALKGLVNSDIYALQLMDRDLATDSTVLSVSLTAKGELRSTKQAVSADDFDVLSEYVTRCIRNMGRNIEEGIVAVPKPDGKVRFTGPDCAYCPYMSVCGYKADSGEKKAKKAGSGRTNAEWIELMREKDESDR